MKNELTIEELEEANWHVLELMEQFRDGLHDLRMVRRKILLEMIEREGKTKVAERLNMTRQAVNYGIR